MNLIALRLPQQTKNDFRAMWRIAFPIMIQSLASTSVNLLDAWMIGALGDAALTAVNINTQFFSRFFHIILFGLGNGGSILIAQYWGIQDRKRIHRIIGTLLTIGGTLGIVFFLIVTLMPGEIVRLYTKDETVINLAERFLQIQGITFLLYPISMVLSASHRATGNTRIPMITGTSAFLLNFGLNYILIFGKFGVPALGTQGAAIGTLISRVVEMILMLLLTFCGGNPCAAPVRAYFQYRKELATKVLKSSGPVVINEFFWGLGVNVYFSFYARISTTAAAAAAAISPIDAFLFITICAMGDAGGILIGNELGRGHVGRALQIARLSLWVNGLSAFFLGGAIILIRNWILSVYALTPGAIEAAAVMLIICGATLPIRAMNYTMIIGILRSGGDVVTCMLIDVCSVWLVGLPITALLSLWLRQPITVVYLGVCAEWLSTFILSGLRTRSRKWLNVLTRET